MLKKFLEEVVGIVVGKQAESIAGLLDGNKYVNEFLIAKKLDTTINQTRNILYKLSDKGLVSSIRKKDKKKGWYTYFWKIEVVKNLEFLKQNLINKIDQINHQVKSRESKQFYVCERCNIEYSEENALLHDFTCIECGEIFSLKDNTKLLKEFGKHLDRLNKELKLLDEELEIEKAKVEKKRMKEIKKEEAEKAKKRAKRKKELARLRKKIKKKSVKNVKKKPVKKSKRKKPAKKSSKKRKVKNKKVKKTPRKKSKNGK